MASPNIYIYIYISGASANKMTTLTQKTHATFECVFVATLALTPAEDPEQHIFS